MHDDFGFPEELDYELQDAWNRVAPKTFAFLPWHTHATGEPWDTLRRVRGYYRP